MTKKLWVGSTLLSAALLLGACSDDEATTDIEQTENVEEVEQTTTNEPTEEAKEVEDGLMIAPEDFEQRFNAFSEETAAGILPNLVAGEIQNGDVQDTITYEVGNSVAISASIKKETGLINYLTFIGVPDGSEMATMQILTGLGSTIATVDPTLTPDERGQVLRDLGLMDEDFNILDHEQETWKNDINYHISTSDVTGILLTIGK